MNSKLKDNIYLIKNYKIKRISLLTLYCIDFTLGGSGLILAPTALLDSEPVVCTFFFIIFIAFVFLGVLRYRNFLYLDTAIRYSYVFMNKDEPFIDISQLGKNLSKKDKSYILKNIEGALKKGYLVNCTIEVHNGVPKIALAKKIVKDKCQNCGAPIVGAENNLYRCEYCGNKISNVINKK